MHAQPEKPNRGISPPAKTQMFVHTRAGVDSFSRIDTLFMVGSTRRCTCRTPPGAHNDSSVDAHARSTNIYFVVRDFDSQFSQTHDDRSSHDHR